MIERKSSRWWLMSGLLTAVGLWSGTWVATGAWDVLLFGSGALASLGGGWASYERRRIEQLPLTIAPVLARTETLAGPEYIVRACLGRGRRCTIVSMDASVGDRVLAVRHHEGALVGPFQAAFTSPEPGRILVRVVVDEGGETTEDTRVFGDEDVVDGRFVALRSSDGAWLDARDFAELR